MGELLNLDLEQKAVSVRERLIAAVREHGRVVYSNSLGAEAMVLTDIIWTHVPEIDMFSIDTGRLHQETYDLLEKLERRYKRSLHLVSPDAQALQRYGLVEQLHAGFAAEFASVADGAFARAERIQPGPDDGGDDEQGDPGSEHGDKCGDAFRV